MAMTRSNKMLAIGGGVVALLVVGWFVLSSMADSRAERQIDDFLTELGVRDQIHWENLSASPFGSVRLEGVSVDARGFGGQELQIARVDIDDFVDDDKRKRADVQLAGIATVDGFSPLGAIAYLRAGGRSALPPAAIHIQWDLDLDDDDLTLDISVGQPEAMHAQASFELERVRALTRLGSAAQPTTFPGPFGRAGRAGAPSPLDSFAGIGAMLGVLESLGDVRVRHAGLTLRDDGYIKRSVALHKRYAIPVSAAGGSVDKQRNEGFARVVEGARADCEKQFPFGSSASDRRRNCSFVLDFLTGEQSSLSLKLRPDRPVPLSSLMQAGVAEPERLMQSLKPEIGS